MTLSEDLLAAIIKAGESERVSTFTTGSVTWSVNATNDTLTASVVIPVEIRVDGLTNKMTIGAKDFLTPPTWAP